MPKNKKEIWERIGRLKFLVALEKGRGRPDERVISGFRSEIIMLYEILCPTPEKEEENA